MSGRYFVVVDAADVACEVVSSGEDVAKARVAVLDQKWGRGHRIVECIAMPRVTVRFAGFAYGEDHYAAELNGLCTATGPKAYATKFARDLRRALRKGQS